MITYKEACEIAENGALGRAVEGHEIACYASAYYQVNLDLLVERFGARLKRTGIYSPELAWQDWQNFADTCALSYGSNSLAPGMPGFRPAARHTIDRDGRQMAAYYLEMDTRRAIFAAAGLALPSNLADCE